MNKTIRITRIIIYIVMAAALLLIALQYTKLPKGAESLTILAGGEPADGAVTLYTGSEMSLEASISPEGFSDREVSWEIADSSVASVDESGKLTALSSGTTTLTAEAAGCSAELEINVEDPVTSIEGFETDVTMDVGYSYTVEPVINTVPGAPEAPAPVYASDDESVVTVDETGLITGVGSGMANVTVTAGGQSETIIVRVR